MHTKGEYCNCLLSRQEVDAKEGSERQSDEGIVYRCPACGAEMITDQTTVASFCYYCHNPVVLSGRLSRDLLPDLVIPFSVDRSEAKKLFLNFFQRRKFIPKEFFDYKQMDHLTGVYFPYWVYEVYMRGSMKAKGIKNRVWRRGKREFREIRFYEVERSGGIQLGNIARPALNKASYELIKDVLPYRLEDAKPFHFDFLSGVFAEKGDIDKDQIREKLERDGEKYADDMLRESANNYETITDMETCYSNKKDKLSSILFPVWTLTYHGKNNSTYYYSMNGQTKKVYGKLPIDYKKIAIISLMWGLIVFLVVIAGGYILW